MATTLKFVTQYGIENVGSVSISSGTAASPGISLANDENSGIFSPGDNILAFSTDGVERLRFSAVGAWGIAGANYGTSGQLLTSNGSAAAPSWQTIIPAQTGNSGKYLTTDGSSASWSVITAVSSLANTTVLGTSNTAVTLIGPTSPTYAEAPMTIKAGPGQYNGNALTVSGGDGGAQGGGDLTLRSGTGYYLSTGTAGTVTIHADNATAFGGAVNIRGGNGERGGGNLTLSGGRATLFGASGAIVFNTAASTTLSERFRILANGAWSVGSDGTSYGASAQVLTSNGNAAPTWQAVPSSLPSQTGNSGKYLTTDGSTASWATVSGGGTFTGGTVAGATSFSSTVAFGARYDELRSDVTATATTNFDCALSNVANVTLSASITTLTFSNVPASGRVFTLTLFLNQDATGSRTVAWPAAVKWPAAAAPTLTATASKTDIITLVTHDGGTNWYGFVAGQNF